MLPKEEIYIPPMNIKVVDHRNFGRKPIVGLHIIKKLSRFHIDPQTELFDISSLGRSLEVSNASPASPAIKVDLFRSYFIDLKTLFLKFQILEGEKEIVSI